MGASVVAAKPIFLLYKHDLQALWDIWNCFRCRRPTECPDSSPSPLKYLNSCTKKIKMKNNNHHQSSINPIMSIEILFFVCLAAYSPRLLSFSRSRIRFRRLAKHTTEINIRTAADIKNMPAKNANVFKLSEVWISTASDDGGTNSSNSAEENNQNKLHTQIE